MGQPFANADWFFLMAPDWALLPLVVLWWTAMSVRDAEVAVG